MDTSAAPPPRTAAPVRRTVPELARQWAESYPEALGPGVETESGHVVYGGGPHPRIGKIPPLLDPATRDRERAETAARWDAMSPAERAAIEHMHALADQRVREQGGGRW
jgi:hypothetical protein